VGEPSAAKKVGSPFAAIQTNPMTVLDQQNNWGRTEEIAEDNVSDELVRVQLDMMAYIVVVVRAVEFTSGDNPTQLYQRAEVRWGNGNVLTVDVLDATGGLRYQVNASTVEVIVFLSDADGNSPVAGSGAAAKFEAFASVGVDPYGLQNTSFFRGTAPGAATIIAGLDGSPTQGRLTQIYGFADNTSGAPEYLLIFDSNVEPSVGDPNPGPLLEVFALPPGLDNFSQTYIQSTLPFINGISYGVSSSPTTYVPAAASVVRVTAEQTNT
jgi:hypothetical protein